MNIITEERIVPERRYTETKYKAIDGKEFTTEADCLKHEQYLERIQHPVIKSHISNVMTFNDEHEASLYYLSSEEDFNFLIDCMGFSRRDYIDDNFAQHGAGWYLFFCDSSDDYYGDSYCIYNLDAYLYDLRLDVDIYENKLRSLINSQ